MALNLLTGDVSVSRLHGCCSLSGFDEWTFFILMGCVVSAGGGILF